MSVIVNKAARVAAPFPGASVVGTSGVNTTNLTHAPGGVQAFAISGTVTSIVVDPSFQGQYVVAQAIGANCQFGFKWGSAAALTWNAVSTIDGGLVATSNAARGATLFDGLPREFIVPSRPLELPTNQKLYLSVITGGGSAQFELHVSE